MPPQVSKQVFKRALAELGHDPSDYMGKKLSIGGMAELYEMDEDVILEAISLNRIDAHYDYRSDTIWVDALDAAHFYFCVRSEAHLYSQNR
jgi:hypothetical protein